MVNGQPFAATAAASGAGLVAACPGPLIHGNDLNRLELQSLLYNHPDLSGITAEQVIAVTAVNMQYMQGIARAAPAAPSTAEPNVAGTAGEDLKQQESTAMDADDPLTSDDEENEMLEANKQGDEVLERKKMKRSAKVERRAKKAKSGGVISTIGPKQEKTKESKTN